MNALGFSGMNVYLRHTLILRLNTGIETPFLTVLHFCLDFPLCLPFFSLQFNAREFKKKITVNRLQLGMTRNSGWFVQKYKVCQYQTQPDLRTTGVK